MPVPCGSGSALILSPQSRQSAYHPNCRPCRPLAQRVQAVRQEIKQLLQKQSGSYRPRFVVAYRFFVLGSRRSFSLAVSTSGGAGPLRGSIVGKPSYFEGMGIIPTATHTI